MPTYQYRCTECGNDLEVVQKFSDPTLTVCPNCEGALRKVFNAVGVVFKGSGFYRTDSRSSGDKAAAGTSRPKSESSESSNGSKSGADSGNSSSSGSTAEKSSTGSSEKSSGSSEKKASAGSSTGSKAASN